MMNNNLILLILICFWISIVNNNSFANQIKTSKGTIIANKDFVVPVLFPPEKNSVKILPQKFEYSLIDHDHIRVGDVILDANSTIINLKTENNNFSFTFSWPLALLKKGTLQVKSQTGKTIFKEVINENNLKIINPVNHVDGIRDELAQIEFQNISPELVEDMKYMPFFNFCVFREDLDVNINLCSRDLYLSYAEENLKIKPRDSEDTSKPTFILINDKKVTEHGLIFLYNKTEKISFKAQSSSGMYLEISTLKEDLEFIDAVQGKTEDKAVVIARGPEPLGQIENIERTPYGWKTTVDTERPYLYISALGDIPLRQDMLMGAKLPKENYRPYLKKAILRSYSSNAVLNGQLKPDTHLSQIDSNSTSESLPNNEFKWALSNLEKRVLNKRYLTLNTPDGPFVIMQEVYRGASNDFSILANKATSMTEFGVKIGKWWSPRIGTYLSSTQESFTNPDSESALNISASKFDFYYRFNPGLFNDTPSAGAELSYMNLKSTDYSLPFIGFGFFLSKLNNLKWLGDWQWIQLQLYPICSDSNYKKSSMMNISFSPKYFITPTLYTELNVGYQKLDIKSDTTSNSKSSALIGATLGILF